MRALVVTSKHPRPSIDSKARNSEGITMSLHTSTPVAAADRDSARPARGATFSPRRLLPATGTALGVSLLGVLAIRAAAVSGNSDAGRFSPLHPASVVSLTV